MGGGNNAGHARRARALRAPAQLGRVGQAGRARSGSSPSPTRTRRRRSSGRGCSTPTARSSARSAATRPCGGSRPSTCSCASSHPRSERFNALLRRRLRARRGARGRVAPGRGAARTPGGGRRGRPLRRELLHVQRGDGLALPLPRARAGRCWFFPGAEVVHLGGASHGGRLYVENLRGILRFLAKHRGAREAERARRLLLLWSLRLRALVFRGERGRRYREGARFLASGDVQLAALVIGEYLRLAFATAVVLLPGWLVARALGQRGASRRLSPGPSRRLFVAWAAVFASTGRSRLAAAILAAIGVAALVLALARRPRAPAAGTSGRAAPAAPGRGGRCFAGRDRARPAPLARRGGGRRRRRSSTSRASASSSTSGTSTCARSTSSRTAASIRATPSRSGTASWRSSPRSPGSTRTSSSSARRLGARAARVPASPGRPASPSSARPAAASRVLAASLALYCLAAGHGGSYVSLALPATALAAAVRPGGVRALLPLRRSGRARRPGRARGGVRRARARPSRPTPSSRSSRSAPTPSSACASGAGRPRRSPPASSRPRSSSSGCGRSSTRPSRTTRATAAKRTALAHYARRARRLLGPPLPARRRGPRPHRRRRRRSARASCRSPGFAARRRWGALVLGGAVAVLALMLAPRPVHALLGCRVALAVAAGGRLRAVRVRVRRRLRAADPVGRGSCRSRSRPVSCSSSAGRATSPTGSAGAGRPRSRGWRSRRAGSPSSSDWPSPATRRGSGSGSVRSRPSSSCCRSQCTASPAGRRSTPHDPTALSPALLGELRRVPPRSVVIADPATSYELARARAGLRGRRPGRARRRTRRRTTPPRG